MQRINHHIAMGLSLLILGSPPALAQNQNTALSHKITVTRTQNGKIVATWPWLTREAYQQAILSFPLDPPIPPQMAQVADKAQDQIDVQERLANGTLQRAFTLANGTYRYTYYLYNNHYYDDTAEVFALLGRLIPLLPNVKDNNVPPPLTLTVRRDGQLRTLAIDDKKTIAMILDAVKRCRPLNQIEEMDIKNTFDSSDAIHIVARPDLVDWPSEMVVDQYQIRTTTIQANTRLFEDRQNMWDAALAQKAIYDEAIRRGIPNPPPVNY